MHPCKILIIDDDKDDVEILSDAFIKNGIEEVHYVDSAHKAIEYLNQIEKEEDLPKLIVTDLYLPAKNGLELISDLGQTAPYNKIPVVLLSTLRYEMVQDMNKEISFSDYIKKPNSYDEYLQVARFLQQRIVA